MVSIKKAFLASSTIQAILLLGLPMQNNAFLSNGQPHRTKCPFHTPEDRIKINNMPSLPEKILIKTVHFLSRALLQKGGVDSSNVLVKLASYPIYFGDVAWGALDSTYHAKRAAMFGQNYVASMNLHIGKYDENAMAKDSIDARLVSNPQSKQFRIGNFIVNPSTSSWFGEGSGKGWRGKKNLVPLFISSEGTAQNPACVDPDQPRHEDMNKLIMDNFLGEEQVKAILERQSDEVSAKLLKEFGEKVKGKSDTKSDVAAFLPKFLIYTLFDVDIDRIPKEAIDMTETKFFLNLFGPEVVASVANNFGVLKAEKIRNEMNIFSDFIYNESKVFQKSFINGSKGLTKRELCDAIPIVFVTAGFAGIRDLSWRTMDYTPPGYLESVVNDPEKLRNAILETARLDPSVPQSGQVIDDDEGLTTKIGKKTLTFPKGTATVNIIRGANWDEERFPDPFVFDPENRDFSKLTTFNSVGESTYAPSPRICPGRNVAINTAALIIKAKLAAEAK